MVKKIKFMLLTTSQHFLNIEIETRKLSLQPLDLEGLNADIITNSTNNFHQPYFFKEVVSLQKHVTRKFSLFTREHLIIKEAQIPVPFKNYTNLNGKNRINYNVLNLFSSSLP